jgi:hypothetical protein
MLDHRKVMRNEKISQPELNLKRFKQVYNLGLNRYVERGNRLVAYDEIRIQRKRAGYADALTLAAGKLVRLPVLVVLLNPHGAHKPEM